MDFFHDQMATGRKLPILTVVDTFSRLSPVVDPQVKYFADDVIATLDQACRRISYPKTILPARVWSARSRSGSWSVGWPTPQLIPAACPAPNESPDHRARHQNQRHPRSRRRPRRSARAGYPQADGPPAPDRADQQFIRQAACSLPYDPLGLSQHQHAVQMCRCVPEQTIKHRHFAREASRQFSVLVQRLKGEDSRGVHFMVDIWTHLCVFVSRSQT